MSEENLLRALGASEGGTATFPDELIVVAEIIDRYDPGSGLGRHLRERAEKIRTALEGAAALESAHHEPGGECPHPSTEAELNAEHAARYRWLRERVRAVYDINGEPVQIVYPKRGHPQLEGWQKRLDVAIDEQIETEARLNREYSALKSEGDSK